MADSIFEYTSSNPRSSLIPHLAAHGLHYPGNAEVNFRGTYAKVIVDASLSGQLILAKVAW